MTEDQEIALEALIIKALQQNGLDDVVVEDAEEVIKALREADYLKAPPNPHPTD